MEDSNIEKRIETEGFVSATIGIYEEMKVLEAIKEQKRKEFDQAESAFRLKKEELDSVVNYANDRGFSDKSIPYPVLRLPYKENILEVRKYQASASSVTEIIKFTIPPFNPDK